MAKDKSGLIIFEGGISRKAYFGVYTPRIGDIITIHKPSNKVKGKPEEPWNKYYKVTGVAYEFVTPPLSEENRPPKISEEFILPHVYRGPIVEVTPASNEEIRKMSHSYLASTLEKKLE